ncbi:MAG: thiol:disulfide interchange protein DsbC [Pseudohongiellaceae bacterium]|jgi:thiol:disulfide interchange protein DsbC
MKQFAAFIGLFFASLTFAESLSFSANAVKQNVETMGVDGSRVESQIAVQGFEGQGIEAQTLMAAMQLNFPLKRVVSINAVANGSLFQVHFASGLILYALPDGEYFLAGNLFQASAGAVVDLTKQLKQKSNAQLLATLQANEYLTLPVVDVTVNGATEPSIEGAVVSLSADLPIDEMPVGEMAQAKHVIYVFVDIDCYYCQFQHQESAVLNAAGVEVRYLSYNRQKPGSAAYHKVRRTWCSKEPQAALDMMMQGRSLAEQSCTEGLMDKHIELAKALGIKRLPAVVTPDGRLTEGLLRALQIFNLLGIEPPQEPVEASERDVTESPVLP